MPLMLVSFGLPGISRQVWSARHCLPGLDHGHGPRETSHDHKVSLYYHTYLVYSVMAQDLKRRQLGPGCSWGHQTAFCFRESGLQFTMKQLRESSNHSPCCVTSP